MQPATTIVCLRGPSGSGKTTLAAALAARLGELGLRTGFVKRSHHILDVAGKDSHRLAAAGAASVLLGADGTVLLHRPDAALPDLLALLPAGRDVVLVETFRPERFPVFLAAGCTPTDGETLLGHFPGGPELSAAWVEEAAALVAALHQARAAAAAPAPEPKSHRCAGAVLGRRLARFAAALLELDIPRPDRRLHVLLENDGCAADAIAAATGCRPGNRNLRFAYLGKMAATFTDTETGRSLRVTASGDCRAAALLRYPDMDRHLAQLLYYAEAGDGDLFRCRWADPPSLPGQRRRHVLCAGCDEEVDGDAVSWRGEAGYCRPCAADLATGHTTNEEWSDIPGGSR